MKDTGLGFSNAPITSQENVRILTVETNSITQADGTSSPQKSRRMPASEVTRTTDSLILIVTDTEENT